MLNIICGIFIVGVGAAMVIVSRLLYMLHFPIRLGMLSVLLIFTASITLGGFLILTIVLNIVTRVAASWFVHSSAYKSHPGSYVNY